MKYCRGKCSRSSFFRSFEQMIWVLFILGRNLAIIGYVQKTRERRIVGLIWAPMNNLRCGVFSIYHSALFEAFFIQVWKLHDIKRSQSKLRKKGFWKMDSMKQRGWGKTLLLYNRVPLKKGKQTNELDQSLMYCTTLQICFFLRLDQGGCTGIFKEFYH